MKWCIFKKIFFLILKSHYKIKSKDQDLGKEKNINIVMEKVYNHLYNVTLSIIIAGIRVDIVDLDIALLTNLP